MEKRFVALAWVAYGHPVDGAQYFCAIAYPSVVAATILCDEGGGFCAQWRDLSSAAYTLSRRRLKGQRADRLGTTEADS
jgi:hypothetical protein